ncbi:MAG: UDP-3-O-acyl-N-acetylglucosamine deacetylase [Hyphomicrobium sp.]|nr:UDP-3-O-acyl-N-acetylglucosamine deacetylase [Hyphomicrobium sp.]
MSNRFIGARQTTIAREIEVTGTGVHSGAPVSVILHPAAADTGLRFLVTKRGRVVAEIPASVEYVKNLTLCTVLGNDAGITVGTVEHLLSALRVPCHRQLHHRDRQQGSADHGRERRSLRGDDR